VKKQDRIHVSYGIWKFSPILVVLRDKFHFCLDLAVRKKEPVRGWTPSAARVSTMACVMGLAGWQGAARCWLGVHLGYKPRHRVRLGYLRLESG
jgi:hypothetical protein